jgi:hypothetical protein
MFSRLTIDQLKVVNKHLREIEKLQILFKNVNHHFKTYQDYKEEGKQKINITIDSVSFVSYTTSIDHEKLCTLIFEMFENHMDVISDNGINLDAKLKDACTEPPFFNKYGLIRNYEPKVEGQDETE